MSNVMTAARLASAALTIAALAVATGCASSHDPPAPTPLPGPATLVTTSVAWNQANVDVGTVQAVAEQATSVLVFGSKGVLTFTSGSLVSTDESITAWRSAALVPSSDGISSWMIGVDSAGHLQRLVSDSAPQDVSDRYGLTTDKVMNVAAGATSVAFLIDSGVAVSDGTKVTHYEGHLDAVAANGGIVAVADGAQVRVFDQGKETDAALADVAFVAFDSTGKLMAATPHGLFEVNGTQAKQVYDARGRTIHQLTGAGAKIWVSVDGDIGTWDNGQLALTFGGTLAPDAQLVGSASGDVWTITGGKLLRWTAQGAAVGGDEATWNATVQPVYAAVCSNCHSPAGSGKDSSGIDLSTYAAWNGRRPQVYARVVTQAGMPGAMPPPSSSFTLTDAQRSAIEAWSKP